MLVFDGLLWLLSYICFGQELGPEGEDEEDDEQQDEEDGDAERADDDGVAPRAFR